MDNVEGVQQWKSILLEHVGQKKIVVDLGSGKTYPYFDMLDSYLTPHELTFVDINMEASVSLGMGEHRYSRWVKDDASAYLLRCKDQSIDYLWASEFFEHIPPHKQSELHVLIREKAKMYTLTFPTIIHHDFHKDWTHRPVMLPHHQFLLYGKTAWEGMISNDKEAIEMIKERYPHIFQFRPINQVSRARLEKLGDEAYD